MSRLAIHEHHRWFLVVWPAAFSLLLLGCGETIDNNSRYFPSPDAAESAVKASMEAWLRGEQEFSVAGTKPVVQFSDSHRKPGLSLVRYEILGEVAGNAPRCYAVKAFVKTEQDETEKELRLKYVVMGIDPVLVWGHNDYEMIQHWDHNMKEPVPPETPRK